MVQGLAPRRLLKGDSLPLVFVGEGSDKGEEELCETETGELADMNADVSNDSESMNENINSNINNGGETKGRSRGPRGRR